MKIKFVHRTSQLKSCQPKQSTSVYYCTRRCKLVHLWILHVLEVHPLILTAMLIIQPCID